MSVFRGPSRSGGSGATGRTVGIVIAVVLVCVIIGVSVYCFNARRGRRGQGQVISKKEQKGILIVRTLKLKKGLFFEFNAPTIRKDEFSIL